MNIKNNLDLILIAAGVGTFALGYFNLVPQLAPFSNQIKLAGLAATTGGVGYMVYKGIKGNRFSRFY